MVIKVGINGFGRIGRIITRTCLQNSNVEVAAINDPAITTEYICYLLKFDSTHGKLLNNITHFDNLVTIDDVQIKVFHETQPSKIPWQIAGVQYVVESSGMFSSLEKASGHIENNGVKRVIVTAPSTDVPMIILGVNDHKLSPRQKVISCASSTLYCLAPIIKILEDNFGISEGFITSIHAMTPSLKPLDGLCLRGKHWRDHRSIHQNIIPAATGACKALGKIIPQVKDKLSGLAFRVPIVNVSVLDISVRLNTNINFQDIVKAVEKSSLTNMANIIKITNEDAVSSDFMGEKCSCIFDTNCSIQLKPNFYKIICWYENEYSYACRVVDSILFSEKRQCFMELPSTLTYVVPNTVNKCDEMLQTDTASVHVSVACDHNDRISKSVGSSSDIFDTAKSESPQTSSGQMIIKKPLKSGSVPCCNNNNTNNGLSSFKPIAKQNPGSFIHSCIAFSSSTPLQNRCLIAKERLEMLRREFSNMLNISEDHQKKSNSIQAYNEILVKDNNVKNSLDTSNLDACKKSFEMKPVGDPSRNLKDVKEIANNVVKNGVTNFYALAVDISASNVHQHIPEVKVDQKTSKDFRGIFPNTEVKDLMTNTVDTLVDDMKQNIVKDSFVKLQNKNVNCLPSISDIDMSKYPNTISSILPRQAINTEHDSNVLISPLVEHVHIFDQALKKHNMLLVDPPFTIISSADIYDNKKKSEPQGKYVASKEILNNLNKVSSDTIVVFSEGTSGRASPDQRERLDVYDKLESESETDSNNSFEVHGKKSQIIHITDLTNSLEDLSRLDKICRIIEISDELSDKLFSNLDNERVVKKNTKWSFKDLCDTIKLDEFCNKVFGSCI